MNYILLGRELDNEAKKSGYPNCPDDLIHLLIEYIGDIRQKGTGFFTLKIRYSLFNNLSTKNSILGDFVNKPQKFYKKIYFCSVCNRIYPNKGKNHRKTKKHIRNLDNGIYHNWGGLKTIENLDKIPELLIVGLRFNPEKIGFKEIWDY